MSIKALLLALMLLQAPAAPSVTVEPLSGPAVTGTLVALDGQQAVVESDGRSQAFPLRDLQSVVMGRGPAGGAAPGSASVQLVDGSRVVASSYTVRNGTATMRVCDRGVETETRNVQWVRFKPASAAIDPQWQEIVTSKNAGDVLVFRPSDTSLDQLEGLLHDVDTEVVEFELDQQRIPVKRAKLEGIIYFAPDKGELPAPIGTVHDVAGSSWKVKSIQLQDDALRLVTVGGTSCVLPVSAVARLDFSSGNVTYLSDLDFELVECTPFIESRIPHQRILQLYGPRRNVSFRGTKLAVGEGNDLRQYDRGLAIHSRSLLVFRLTEDYRRFSAVAGVDGQLRGWGSLELVIFGDDTELFRKTLSGNDPPVPVDLDLTGVRRLKILVDFGRTSDVADQLNLCDARIIK